MTGVSRFILLLLSFSVGLLSEGLGQSNVSDNASVTAYYHFGYVLPEYSNFIYIVEKPVRAFSLNFSKKTRGKNDWEKIYNYPEYGIALFYSTLGNDKIHGREFAVNPYCHLNIISRQRFNFFNETAFGLGYITKRFDPETNYLNIAVGSHVNLHFSLKFGVNYLLFDKLRLNAGLSFDHFSNANSKNPNLGINSTTSFVGLSYPLGKITPVIEHELTPYKKSIGYELVGSIGTKRSRGVLQSGLYYTGSLTFETKWKPLRAIHFGVGVDLFYDPSTKTEMEATGNFGYKKSNDLRTGIHLSQEFIYSRLSLILQQGFYLGLTDSVSDRKMYNRGIVRVSLSDRMFVQLAMKSHLNILDYPELGLGLKW
jgi:hypothetical protein